MTLRITDTKITSDEIGETARRDGMRWYLASDPGRTFDRDTVISTLKLAEALAKPEPDQALINSLRSELQTREAPPRRNRHEA